MSPIKLVSVYSARGEAEALIIKGLLESCGIEAMLSSAAAPSVHVFAVDDLGQVSVLVRPEDAEAARELVKGENNA